MNKVKILELFGGIGAIRKAFINLKIPYEVVDYVEIDKACVKSYNALYGEDYKPKSVVGYKAPNEKIDLIMHGSPCQDFSRIGKKQGGVKNSGTRSSLLFETIRIIKEMKESQKLINNVLQISNDKKIDIYGMGVVGKNLIDILDNNNICINYIFDKDARKYKTYSSVQLENVKDIDKNIIFVAVMRDNKEIIEKLIKQGYKKDNVYLIENLV